MRRTQTVRAATANKASRDRQRDLRQVLDASRRHLMTTVVHGMRDVRAERESDAIRDVDDGAAAEGAVQEDIQLALLEMRTETLARIDAALAQLEAGRYGYCTSCDEEIAATRLRALPFAVRCRDCQAEEESARVRAKAGAAHGPSPF